jgi:hypothetical protein
MLILLLTGFAVTAATFAFAMQYGFVTAVMAGVGCGAIGISLAAISLNFAAQRGRIIARSERLTATDKRVGGLLARLEKR